MTEEETPKEEVEDTSIVAKANEAADRLEKANAKQEELLNRQAEQYAKERLGGQTDAGGVVLTDEEKQKHRISEALKESGLDPFK